MMVTIGVSFLIFLGFVGGLAVLQRLTGRQAFPRRKKKDSDGGKQ